LQAGIGWSTLAVQTTGAKLLAHTCTTPPQAEASAVATLVQALSTQAAVNRVPWQSVAGERSLQADAPAKLAGQSLAVLQQTP